MTERMALTNLPSGIEFLLNGNFKKGFCSVYINEQAINLESELKNIKRSDFRYYSYEFNTELLTSISDWKLFHISLSKKPAQESFEITKGHFFILEDIKSGVFYIFSPNNIRYINRAIHSFMNDYFYPRISRAFLTSRELFDTITHLEEIIKSPILGRNSSGKVLFGTSPETIITFAKGTKPKNFKEHFSKARQDGKWVSWISLETSTSDGRLFHFSLSRECNIGLNVGELKYFLVILNKIAELGLKKCRFLQSREIKKDSSPKPIMFEYELDVFNDDSNRKKLISQITQYPNCSYSIIHGGNPHIYMYVMDRVDKSVFSFRTTGFRTIVITAQLTSNYAALLRFVNYLTENFSEFKEMKEFEKETSH
jgi:hypothetical protein